MCNFRIKTDQNSHLNHILTLIKRIHFEKSLIEMDSFLVIKTLIEVKHPLIQQ
jgi:hypothetical protein